MEQYMALIEDLEDDYCTVTHLELHEYVIPKGLKHYDLIRALRRNQTLRKVVVWKEFLEKLSLNETHILMETIGDIPSIEAIFCDVPNDTVKFPLNLLTIVLERAPHLKSLSLRNVVLKRQEYELAAALQRHRSLEQFRVREMVLGDRRITLDPLFCALSCIPTLLKVEIRLKHRQSGALTMGPLRSLLRSRTLIEMKFWQLELQEDLIMLMAATLQTNPTLKVLTLFDCHLTRNGYIAIAHMLMVNTSLKSLELYDEDMNDTCCMLIAHGLEKNSTLQALTLQPLEV